MIKFRMGYNKQIFVRDLMWLFIKNTMADQLGEKIYEEPFEGGKIHIVNGLKGDPNGVRVLLNGKEIAKSVVTPGVSNGSNIELAPGIPKHGGLLGLLLSDNVYERAFKVAKKVIKTLPINTLTINK